MTTQQQKRELLAGRGRGRAPAGLCFMFVDMLASTFKLPRSPDHAIRATASSYMRRLANACQRDPRVIMAARLVVGCAPERDTPRQLDALHEFVRDNWYFVEDPWDNEAVQSPAESLEMLARYGRIYGDCDDAAVLCAGLGKCVGFPARYVVLAWGDPAEPYSHVVTELLGGIEWRMLDVTRPRWLTRLPYVGRYETFEV